MSRVLITRTLQERERRQARQLGLELDEIDVLEVAQVPSLAAEWLGGRRAQAARYDAWIFTSRHAVAALATLQRTGILGSIRPCHAVGAGTAAALTALGIPCTIGPGSGAALARQLVAAGTLHHVLHWRGDEVAGSLGAGLRAAGIEVDEWIVYHKRPRQFSLDPAPYAAVLVLSPSGVRALAAGFSAPPPDQLRFVAIGPTTAGEVETVFARPAVMPAAPRILAMLECAARETADGSTPPPPAG